MFYHHDAIGNTLAMTDMTGAAVNTYRYKAFGASELISGTALNNRQFTGHVSDNTGLIYMNARYYDPATGRFLTQDTVPGRPMDPLSYNLYAYCKNNPTAYTDPSGHWGPWGGQHFEEISQFASFYDVNRIRNPTCTIFMEYTVIWHLESDCRRILEDSSKANPVLPVERRMRETRTGPRMASWSGTG